MVVLWAVRTFSYHNPNEVYPYHSLPFCSHHNYSRKDNEEDDGVDLTTKDDDFLSSASASYAWETFAVLHPPIEGSERVTTQTYKCTTEELTEQQASTFTNAVKKYVVYQLMFEDLPIWGKVGEMKSADHSPNILNWKAETHAKGTFVPLLHTKRRLRLKYVLSRGSGDGFVYQADLVSDAESLQPIESGKSYDFELIVEWDLIDGNGQELYDGRFERYLDYNFFNHPVRRFSFLNSLLVAVFLVLITVAAFRKILKESTSPGNNNRNSTSESKRSDAATPSPSNKNDLTLPLLQQDDCTVSIAETGIDIATWSKLSLGDLLRPPPRIDLLAALIGNGWHMTSLLFGATVWFSCDNSNHMVIFNGGGRLRHLAYLYVVTSLVGGCASGHYFQQQRSLLEENDQGRAEEGVVPRKPTSLPSAFSTLLLTQLLLPTMAAVTISAIQAASTVHVDMIRPFSLQVVLRLTLLWTLGAVPLCTLGFLLGRRLARKSATQVGSTTDSAYISHAATLLLPTSKRTMHLWMLRRPRRLSLVLSFAQVITFGVIFIELYYLMISLWGYKFYLIGWTTVLILLVFVVTIVGLSAMVTVFLLNREAQKVRKLPDGLFSTIPATVNNNVCEEGSCSWQWDVFRIFSFLGIYVFLYSVYFWMFKTNMSGLFQAVYYFGTMSFLSILVALAAGSVAHCTACKSIRLLFLNQKSA